MGKAAAPLHEKLSAKQAGLFLAHQSLATLGTLVVASVLASSGLAALQLVGVSFQSNVHDILTETPYFPVQITTALILGWLIAREAPKWSSSMRWVWVIPFAILCGAFVVSPSLTSLGLEDRLAHFFGWACRPENRCFDEVSITLPFYSAMAYSVGSVAAQWNNNLESSMSKFQFCIALVFGSLILIAAIFDLIRSFRQPLQFWWSGLFAPVFEPVPAIIGACLIWGAYKRVPRD